jgi:hypothetical protein
MPEKVTELDAMIDRFVSETGALYPKPNPDFNASASNGPPAAEPGSIAGLVARMCEVETVEGAIRVRAEGRTPFLGTAQVKFMGPLTLKLRARSRAGGTGKVQWRTATQETFVETQAVSYAVPAGESWQDITVQVPVRGRAGILRLYLPAEPGEIEIQSIQFLNKSGQEKVWDFSSQPR